MKGKLSSALILGFLSFPAVGLVGCDQESGVREKRAIITMPGGTTTTSTETKVKSTGDNPPPNYAGETGKTGK